MTCSPDYSKKQVISSFYGSQTCNGTSVGDYCSFSCNTGYGVVGASTLVCESTGSWSDPAPSCQGIIEDSRYLYVDTNERLLKSFSFLIITEC